MYLKPFPPDPVFAKGGIPQNPFWQTLKLHPCGEMRHPLYLCVALTDGKAVSWPMFQLNGAYYLNPYCGAPRLWGLESPWQIHCPLVDGLDQYILYGMTDEAIGSTLPPICGSICFVHTEQLQVLKSLP